MTIVPPTIALEIGIVRAALEADYEVLEELGRGGMAIVYRAKDKAIDREVAIKILPFSLAFDNEFVERFMHEARTAGRLEHPSIVPIYRVGRSGQVIFFVMKLLRGQSLAAVLRERGKLDVQEVRRIMIETASALGYAAKSGVVHRDIKPDNILFDHEGRCVVTDFGIAKTAGSALTQAGTSMGTPRYMSPEHAQGKPLDGRSDMYSLGVVAFQCLTGVIPFDGDDPFAVLYKHINNPLPRPTFSTEEEQTLFGIIERMLAKNPDDRFQSAEELIVALGGQVTGPLMIGGDTPRPHTGWAPTEIIETPLSTKIRRWSAKRWPYAAVALVALAGAGVYGYQVGRQPADTAAVSTRATATKTPTGTTAPAPGGVAAAAKPAPPPEPFSRCPRLAAGARPTDLTLMVDAVRLQRAGATLFVNFDVCGLAEGRPFTTDFTVSKVSQSRLRRIVGGTVKPVSTRYPDVAYGPRTRRRKSISLSGLPAGDYMLSVVVMDGEGRRRERTREFQIADQ